MVWPMGSDSTDENSGLSSGDEALGVEGTISRQEEEEQERTQELRKACDWCTRRKRKCDGKAPCRNCLEMNLGSSCTYSLKLKSGRKKRKYDAEMAAAAAAAAAANEPYGNAHVAALIAANGRGRGAPIGVNGIDSARARFGPSEASGLVGTLESFFMATYLRDFNAFCPLTTEEGVMSSMMEVLRPSLPGGLGMSLGAVSVVPSLRKARLAVFWGVVALGAKINNAPDEMVDRYASRLDAAIRECFDCGEKEVVHAYLILSTLETLRGNTAKANRYLKFAETMYQGLGKNFSDERLCPLMYIFTNKLWDEGFMHARPLPQCAIDMCKAQGEAWVQTGEDSGEASSAHSSLGPCDSHMAEVARRTMAGTSAPRPLDALKLVTGVSMYTAAMLRPEVQCRDMTENLSKVDNVIRGAAHLVDHTSLRECVTGIVPIRIWTGVAKVLKTSYKGANEDGLKLVREGVQHAVLRPGLMNFPVWTHALHSAAYVLAFFGPEEEYDSFREVFNANTADTSKLPDRSAIFSGEGICQTGSNCTAVSKWLSRCAANMDCNSNNNLLLEEKMRDEAGAAAATSQFQSQSSQFSSTSEGFVGPSAQSFVPPNRDAIEGSRARCPLSLKQTQEEQNEVLLQPQNMLRDLSTGSTDMMMAAAAAAAGAAAAEGGGAGGGGGGGGGGGDEFGEDPLQFSDLDNELVELGEMNLPELDGMEVDRAEGVEGVGGDQGAACTEEEGEEELVQVLQASFGMPGMVSRENSFSNALLSA